jgi:PAS domain-containing protein
MKEKPIPKQLLSLKKKTTWSWERMCREFHRVMSEEGPSHTTLYRYATGKVRRRNKLTERYVKEAIDRVTAELGRKKLKTQQDGELRFRELFEHTQDLIFRYGHNPLGCEYINPAVKDMLGYTPEEFYADRVTRRWIHKNGKVVRCEGVHVPIYDEDGNLVAVEGIAREIPDREQK